jgi:hypothetical protein
MDSPCEPGVKISVSTTATASLCRFIPNASKKQIADQQNAMLGMLRRLGILGPIVWAAYWGDSDLVDCERLWVRNGELADLYAYLNAGIASETGIPELESSLFGKLGSNSTSVAATRKSSQGSPFKRLRYRARKSIRPSRKKTKRPAIASSADIRAKATARPKDEREPGLVRRRRRRTNRNVDRRRAIVKKNRIVTAPGLCELFDNDKIPLPKKQSEAGNWVKAYRTRNYKHAIEQLIYRDRKAVEKSKN